VFGLLAMGSTGLLAPAVAEAFSPFGAQPLLVIPLAHAHPGGPLFDCPTADQTFGPICPPYSPAGLQTMLQNGLDAWYPTETFGQTSWQVRVLSDPNTVDHWWPAPHTLAQYSAKGNRNFTTAVAPVRDAGESILSQAIQDGVISLADALQYHRFLVIDNWNHNSGRAGQTNSIGVPLTYSPAAFQIPSPFGGGPLQLPFVTTASIVSPEVTLPSQVGVNDFLSVVRHELGHQLGEPDLYSQSPCPNVAPGSPPETQSGDNSDCVGPWDHMALDYQGYPGFGLFTRMELGWVDPDPLGTAVKYLDKSFAGTITLDPIEKPQGAPVGISIPADLGAVALARLFGLTGPYGGFLIECRKRLGDDTGIPAEGVLVSYIDPTRGTNHPQDVVRGASTETASTAILSHPPFSSYTNSAYGFSVRYVGSTQDGGCQVAVNVPWSIRYPHVVPAVGWLSGIAGRVGSFGQATSHSVFAGQGIIVNSPARGLARIAAAGPRTTKIAALVRGRLARVRFSYANVGTVRSQGGTAAVSVTEPYTVAACGPQPDGRLVARVRLRGLRAGETATAQVAFRARSSGPIGVTIRFPASGGKSIEQGGIERAVLGFQTHRAGRGGKSSPLSSTILVTSSRHCPGPVSLSASPLVLPKGWTVNVRGLGAALLPGRQRRVSVQVQAPKVAHPQALDIPLAIFATAPAPPLPTGGKLTPSYFAGGEPALLGGLDVLTRVLVPGRPVPAFTLPSLAPPLPSLSYPPALPPRQGSTITLTCPSGGPFGQPETTTGTLSPPDPGTLVTITYTPNRGPSTTHMIAINPDGSFSDSIAPYATVYTVQASWGGDPRLLPTTSSPCSFSAG
jgi:hypothetical protein